MDGGGFVVGFVGHWAPLEHKRGRMMMVSSEGRALGGSYAPRQRRGPPPSLPEPDYSKYDENILNVFLMARFQRALERELDMPAEHVEFDQIVSLSHKIRSEYNHDPLVVCNS